VSRICITGGPLTGKTTRANASGGIAGPVRHADDGSGSWLVMEWFDEPGPWIIEGATATIALRRWLHAHAEGRPCDVVLLLEHVYGVRTFEQQLAAEGYAAIWKEIRGALEARGVHLAREP
jgi:hypothetical protein